MAATGALSVQISHADFDVRALQDSLLLPGAVIGGLATFTGYVRAGEADSPLDAMEIEHYPGMTEKSIEEIMHAAAGRWALETMRVWHRVGSLSPGERIVWVGAAAAHRRDAFNGCEYMIDFLKTDAPFWKKEIGPDGAAWVTANPSDCERRERWTARSTDTHRG